MKFGLGISMSRELNSDLVVDTSNNLEDFFNTKNYGIGIKHISMGFICVSHDFEPFFKVKKPKYVKSKKSKGLDGLDYLLENALLYDCKLDFDSYQNSDDLGRKKLIAQEVLNTTKEVFEKKKIKDFNEKDFIKDLESFFKEQGYLD